MFLPDARWYLGTSWILTLLVIGVVAGAASAGTVLLLALSAVAPPLVMLMLWKQRPVPIAAENRYLAQGRS